jgi:hypothetical protein
VGEKTYFGELKAYFTDTDHTYSNIISRDDGLDDLGRAPGFIGVRTDRRYVRMHRVRLKL